MIMGDKCTRRCPFCDVGHGRPDPLDVERTAESGQHDCRAQAATTSSSPASTATTCATAAAGHFVACIRKIARGCRRRPSIEILVPDFRGRDDRALDILKAAPPDVMNHNLETIPRLYKEARPGSDYAFSLNLLKKVQGLVPRTCRPRAA
jgi:lipoic acid synthetase